MTAADFLHTIIADRDDDGPRLVYADWLEEHGQPERGELIRVQVELARWRCPQYGEPGAHFDNPHHGGMCLECQGKTAPLRRRADLLLGAHLDRWFAESCWAGFVFLTQAPQSHSPEDAPFAVLRRGFVASVTLTAGAFLGGVCPKCAGGHTWEASGRTVTCNWCSATPGRTPGHADALCAATPLEVVRLLTVPQRQEMLAYCRQKGYAEPDVAAWDRHFGNDFLWDNASAWRVLSKHEWGNRIRFELPAADDIRRTRDAAYASILASTFPPA